MPKLSDQERDEFLSALRYGILTMMRSDESPVSVPVWYDWNGHVAQMFAASNSPKIGRLKANPQASLLVVNNLDEIEMWVAFDGPVTIRSKGGFELAEQLAGRYWDLTQLRQSEMLEAWRVAASEICLMELAPDRIRSYKE
jgi:nitroimidazol reductase NimA-like FMN-containing flavoprotein (pyridoxamine 5'-phosphate oxidase superfamily)